MKNLMKGSIILFLAVAVAQASIAWHLSELIIHAGIAALICCSILNGVMLLVAVNETLGAEGRLQLQGGFFILLLLVVCVIDGLLLYRDAISAMLRSLTG